MRSLLPRLLHLFPVAFRTRFGEEMAEQLRVDHDRAASQSRLHALRFSVLAALDLVRSAVAERWNPSWSDPRKLPTPSKDSRLMLQAWTNDLRYALRALRRSPGFTAVTVCTLGLAIGANAGIFSVVDTVLLDPLPYRDTERLVSIAGSAPGSDLPPEFGLSTEFYVQYDERADLLEGIAPYSDFTSTLRADDRVERVRMAVSTASLFPTLGVSPLLGRLPVPEDEDRVVVLSHRLWMTWFGGDREVIGRTYSVSGQDRMVIGVMGPEFWFPNDGTLLWFPFVLRPEEIVPGRFGMSLVARVAPGAEDESLIAELATLARQLPDRFGGSANYARLIEQYQPIVRPLEKELLGGVATPLWLLLGAVGIVLLIACANVTNLFLVRAEHRQRDLAVQRAIGAGRGQLIRSQMAEALVVAALAAVLALALARASVPILVRAAPPDIPRLAEVGITGPTLLFTLAAAAFSALLFGLVPAVRASSPDLLRLREGGRGSTRRRHWGRTGLVIAQTALAIVLVIGSSLLVRSFWQLRNVDPGYDTEDIFTFQIAPEGAHLTDGPSFARFHMDFMQRIAALPGVERVGVVENVPLNEGVRGVRYRTEGSVSEEDAGTLLSLTWAGGDYFATMGIDVLQGRAFVDSDHVSDLGNVVIGQSAANRLWPGEDPIGKRLQREGLESWETVVGVVEDVMQYSLRDEPEALVYSALVGPSPTSWVLGSPAYVVKTKRADEIAPEIRALVREVAPEAPMYRVYTMAGLAADSMVQLSFTMLTLGIASLLALILGAIGLYGVLSYVVAQRTREIGLRIALGAAPRQVQLMVIAQGAQVVLPGVLVGILAAIGTTRMLGGLLFGVEPVDVATFVTVSATMALLGLMATYLPARRASTVDPNRSLQAE
ncbi:MAG TPA: ABC transporter permease [Thermoanaerobaculia bacterium]|nr:ABC transporter permease [Thermoanaerobaculia bacterium]